MHFNLPGQELLVILGNNSHFKIYKGLLFDQLLFESEKKIKDNVNKQYINAKVHSNDELDMILM